MYITVPTRFIYTQYIETNNKNKQVHLSSILLNFRGSTQIYYVNDNLYKVDFPAFVFSNNYVMFRLHVLKSCQRLTHIEQDRILDGWVVMNLSRG